MAYYTDSRKYFEELYDHGHKKKILIEGDSWFSIPDIVNIPLQLDSKLDLSILCLADPGDTLEELSEGRQFKQLEMFIKDTRYGQRWDGIILSTGGNDVIGPEIKGLLKSPSNPKAKEPTDYLIESAVVDNFKKMKKRLNKIRNLRDKSKANTNTPIFIHTYSYLTPRNVAHQLMAWKISGPWVYPHMQSIGIIDCEIQKSIVKKLLDYFYEMLSSIAKEPDSNFHIIDIRTALSPVDCDPKNTPSEYWRDEIHPSSKGFSIITENHFIPSLREAGVV